MKATRRAVYVYKILKMRTCRMLLTFGTMQTIVDSLVS